MINQPTQPTSPETRWRSSMVQFACFWSCPFHAGGGSQQTGMQTNWIKLDLNTMRVFSLSNHYYNPFSVCVTFPWWRLLKIKFQASFTWSCKRCCCSSLLIMNETWSNNVVVVYMYHIITNKYSFANLRELSAHNNLAHNSVKSFCEGGKLQLSWNICADTHRFFYT